MCLLLFIGCKNDKKNSIITKDQHYVQSGFQIRGNFNNYLCDTVYLNALHENLVIPVDTVEVIDNSFLFKGVIAAPERFALSFQNYSQLLVFIVENQNMEMNIDVKDIQNPVISGSPLNAELDAYKSSSKSLFKEIEALYPHFQKARLENDAEKLDEIGKRMKDIEERFTDFTYRYILENRDSYLAGMLLRDRLKTIPIDSVRIREAYSLLPEDIRNSPDGQFIATALQLH